MKRGNFLLGAVSGLAVVASTDHLFARALAQAPLPGLPGGENRVLVLINLQGGNDGLNCVVPYGDEAYYQVRPNLAIPRGQVLDLDAHVGFNPQMGSLKGMYDRGMVAVVQGVGYPKPDHSHFRSTEIWQTAAPDTYEHTGWLGRYLDDANLPKGLFNGVSLSDVLPEVLVAERSDVPAIAQLAGYGLSSDRNSVTRSALTRLVHDGRMPFSSPYLAHVAEVEGDAQRGSQELPALVHGYKTDAAYPATPLGRSLALAAQMIGSANVGTRVIYIPHGSFDTHVSQKGTQDRLLGQFSDAMKAFYDDLAAHGNDKRVLTMTFSEFGRRIAQNASAGTDHGEASPLFLVGGGVKGGIYGTYPDLNINANMGNLKYTTDFRQVYATVLERWLGRPSETILRGRYAHLTALA